MCDDMTPDEHAAFEQWVKAKRAEARAQQPAFVEAHEDTMIGRRNHG
jgi:hypothetical protein